MGRSVKAFELFDNMHVACVIMCNRVIEIKHLVIASISVNSM